jgi:large subunit ribosomal protein L24
MNNKIKIKVKDEVVVVTGSERGRKGKVLHVDCKKNRVIVEGVNKRNKFVRPSQENPNGGAISREFPIHVSNVMAFCDKCKKGVKIRTNIASDKTKSRVCSKCGKSID